MKPINRCAVALVLLIVGGCGDSSDSDEAPLGGVSDHVPYLVGAPTVTFVPNGTDYDVTVTLEADGPTGVMDVSLWIFDVTLANSASLDLTNTPGTKFWTATTNPLIPLPPGEYYVDDIVLNDGDPFTADPLRTGWYISDPLFSAINISWMSGRCRV